MPTRRRKASAAPGSPPIKGDLGDRPSDASADLAASEARYHALVEHSPNPCFVCRDGVLVFLNTAAVRLFGATAANDLLGHPILDRVHPAFRDVAQRRLQAIADGAVRVPSIEMRFLRVDGAAVDAEVDSASIVFDGVPAVYATVQDVTTDRRADALLQSCVRIIQQADALSLDALLQHTLDEAERLTGSCIGFAHFLGADQRTMTLQAWSTNTLNGMCTAEGKNLRYAVDQAGVWVDCVRQRTPVIHNDYAALAQRKGMPVGHAPVVRELVVPVMRDGIVTMVLGVGNKPTDYDARDLETVSRLTDLVWDIIQRKQAEEQLRSSAALLAFSQRLTHTGSWVLDAATQQLTWSDETYRTFGAAPQSFGSTYDAFLEMVHPEDRAAVDLAYTRSVREGSDSYTIEHRIVRRDTSEVRVVREECRHERDAAGRLLRSVGVVQDLTEQRRFEAGRLRDALTLEMAMQASNAATWDWDVASGGITWSAGMFDLFGLDRRTAVASFEAWRTALHPDDRSDAERRIMEALEQHTSLHNEYRVVLPDGGMRWIIATGRGFYDPDGRPERMICLCLDNTAFRQSQDERLAALELLEQTGEMAKVGGWQLDLATQQLTFTRQSLRINEVDPATGLDLAEALGRVDAEYRQRFQAAVQAAIEHGTPYDLEVPMVTATGRRIWARTQGSAVYEAGKVTKLSGTFQDVTERRQADDERRRGDARFRSWFALPLVGICITSPEKGWLEVNDHLCDMLGYERAVLVETTWAQLTHPEDLTKDVAQFERVLRGESDGYSLEKRFVRKDGSTLDADLSVSCVRQSDGAVEYFVALIQDISARKRAEAEKSALESQLHQSQKMESVGRLAGGVAHDFNNMLGVILGNAEIALEQLDETHPLQADLLEIQAAAKRSAALTRQLLAFARRQAVAPEMLDVDQSVRDLLAMLRRLLGEDIDVQWMPAAELWPILMDPSQLANVLTNLCVNARDAIAGVGSITLGATNCVVDVAFCAAQVDAAPGEYVCLSVHDTGSGMDDETLAHIFEPFFTTKGVSEGTGLGLASVYGAIRQNNGFVTVTSVVGEGSTFDLYLPRHHGAASAVLPTPAVTGRRLAGETILLVEDEPGILRMTARVLTSAGYTVLQAGDASEALRVARAHPGEIHLLLTDVVMPTLSGRDLANAMTGVRPQLRCLFMSGHTADVIAHRGMLDPDVSFIEKPYSIAALVAKVREVLDGG